MTAHNTGQTAPSQQLPLNAPQPPAQPGACDGQGLPGTVGALPASAPATLGEPPAWFVEAERRAAAGQGRAEDLGFYPDREAKQADQAHTSKLVEELRKLEEAKAEQARIRAGGPIAVHDVMFGCRAPRDVLRQASPPPYLVTDVPPTIGEFAGQFANATGYDVSGVLVAAVTAAASVIDDGYRLTVRPESSWTVSARQWSFLCGGPSAGKSPCVRAATDHVKRMHGILHDRWRAENEGLRRDERSPLPALFTSDATIAALSNKLMDNPRGMLMVTEEFASWIGGIDSADRGEAAKNRGDWLQLRDGGPHQIDRVERGSIYVPNWGVSVLAACTPDGLAKQMKFMPEDGLIQRFIPCIMTTPDLEACGDARQAMNTWSQWLEWAYRTTTRPTPEAVRLSPEAQVLFDSEVRALRELVISTEGFAPAYAAHLGKHPGMLAEIALTFHVFQTTNGATLGAQVGEAAMRSAITYLRKARRHAYTLYTSVLSSSPAFEIARAIARSIVASDEPVSVVGRDWMTQHCQAFKKAEDRLRREAVQILEDADWLSAQTQARAYGGWPRGYSVHPQVFAIFAREGEQWRARRLAVRDAIGEAQ